MGGNSQHGMNEPAAAASPPATGRAYVAALLSALLLWLCYFPVAWGWLGWVALVPLLCLVRSPARSFHIYAAAWLCGLAFFVPVLAWLRLADDRHYEGVGLAIPAGCLTWAALATYCSLFVPVTLWWLRRLDNKGWPLVLSVPLVWTAVELLRAHLLTGFPWYFLGHTQHAFLALIQVSDVGGAYAVTFLVAAVNAVLFEELWERPWLRHVIGELLDSGRLRSSARPATITVMLALVIVLLYGCWKLGQQDFDVGPRVGLLQGNLSQSLRNAASFTSAQQREAAQEAVDHYRALCDEAMRARPDLIVWPETSWPDGWEQKPDGAPDDFSRRLAETLLVRWPTQVLLGTNTYVGTGVEDVYTRYNSGVLLAPDAPFVGRYDKVHRVPFGEYVPFLDSVPLLKMMAPYDYDYSVRPGDELTRFALGDTHFGVLICFEDTDTYLPRQYVRTGKEPLADRLTRLLAHGMYDHLPGAAAPAADFLVNISNDAWFDGSAEHDEHLAICRFRAIECRRSIVRAVNMGISAVVDGNGRVVALPGPSWSASKKVAAVLVAEVPIDRRGSFYAAHGDWLPGLCLLLAVLGAVGILARNRLLGLVHTFENWNVYHPVSAARDWLEPASAGLRAEDVELVNSDGTRLHGWWCPGQEPANGAGGAILFLHGNAGNLSHRAWSIAEWQQFQHLPVFIVDYPGYGRSQGRPSEQGCYAAAFAAYDWLTQVKQVPPERIILYGDSLGGAVAVELALQRPHHALIIVRAFTSIVDMARLMFPFVPVDRLIHNRFDSAAKIVRCPRPIFIAHGDCDHIVPFNQGERLFALAPEPKAFFRMRGCDHNDALGEDFHEALRQFLRAIQPKPSATPG